VSVGLSVSRVGGNAQTKAMKKVAGQLRLDLAQFRELAAFAQFGSDLDAATKAQLDRGQRLTEALKQPQYHPIAVEDQVMLIWVATNGFLDRVPVNRIAEFKQEFWQYMRTTYPDVGSAIRDTKTLDDKTAESLRTAVEEFLESTTFREQEA